jgi:phosphoribosylformylglycinamidine synthase subunit PurS
MSSFKLTVGRTAEILCYRLHLTQHYVVISGVRLSVRTLPACHVADERLAMRLDTLHAEACVPIMKAKVYVTLKPSVLDPQGKAIKHSVELLGFNGISDIRQGKYFEIAIDGSRSADDARADAEKLAHDVLSNPIIEDFRVEIEQ